ncbi:5-hydroxyisourate hydrolase [Rubricella aquisinus]|uniref:5-hydroxyisourate hydrolase n=1 Tax=Rubricella aquisinus TaxID=2028108 RepID=A0A840WKN4_9RHOB|nr:hydroxyisourate hydrolase [Rubricella aquisinus]MBB5515081.1 5-hydroxyisourate hydrolase [Rubricella aquisinus]
MSDNRGFLTTHVLDTARGCPAAGMVIDLYRLDGSARTHLCQKVTNADGRTDGPILPQDAFETGNYELVFQAGAYLRTQDASLPATLFLDEVPIRFGMAEDDHYHVPLLISPYSFSTYRGS